VSEQEQIAREMALRELDNIINEAGIIRHRIAVQDIAFIPPKAGDLQPVMNNILQLAAELAVMENERDREQRK
jgi:hypothetical protein